ncbi:MAG: Nif3-like dinuclear metal center hexameric protein [Actinobacteria bacterium]|nr:Nif3-like dinuclear metal center hexameric protein [Actinomycetota bacterium]
MSTVADIAGALAEKTRPEKAASWDPVGVQLGDPQASVETVAVCHEVTEEVIAALREGTPGLLVTYHPLLFSPTNRLLAGRSVESRAFSLISMGVSLLVTHTDFDAAPGGAADALAHLLDLREIRAFGEDEEDGTGQIGRVGEFGASLDALDARLSDAFGHTGLRISGDRDRHLEMVAVVPGSGSHLIPAAAEVADALVTGDVSHHRTVEAADLGLAIADPGHVATERPGLEALVEIVRQVTDARVIDLTHLDPQTWS